MLFILLISCASCQYESGVSDSPTFAETRIIIESDGWQLIGTPNVDVPGDIPEESK